MDDRALRELELLPVARLYGLAGRTAQPLPAAVHVQAPRESIHLLSSQCGGWLFVGCAAVGDMDEEGDPFSGPAGKLVDGMLFAIGCRRGEEAEADGALDDRLERRAPKLIVALGKTAALRLLGAGGTLSGLRGKVRHRDDTPVVVTYHPSQLLRSLTEKARAWEDLLLARHTLAAAQ
ncbi:MAG TPA: uracil-DNA glycosylase family protein [Usitatibacter sp.]|nr:uracil-DNA glycosylase family protein [Usitatibacter sp.]